MNLRTLLRTDDEVEDLPYLHFFLPLTYHTVSYYLIPMKASVRTAQVYNSQHTVQWHSQAHLRMPR